MGAKFLLLGRQAWLSFEPPKKRDVRRLGKLGKQKFWTEAAAVRERKERVRILSEGNNVDRELADWLDLKGTELARVSCCPLVSRQFQIYFTALALQTNEERGGDGTLVTLVDSARAVGRVDLHKINWRKEKATLTTTLTRTLGKEVSAIGMGDVEYDEDRECWQPHFHLVVYGATEADIERLRMRAYFAKRGDLRPMLVSEEISIAGWFSYMSRMMTFRKVPNSKRRVRLKDPEFRRLMRYYARHNPTEFVVRHRVRT